MKKSNIYSIKTRFTLYIWKKRMIEYKLNESKNNNITNNILLQYGENREKTSTNVYVDNIGF